MGDAVTLREQFLNDPSFEAPGGGGAYLAQLLMAMVGVINAGEYGRVVRDTWMRREVIALCVEAMEMAFAPQADGSMAPGPVMDEAGCGAAAHRGGRGG